MYCTVPYCRIHCWSVPRFSLVYGHGQPPSTKALKCWHHFLFLALGPALNMKPFSKSCAFTYRTHRSWHSTYDHGDLYHYCVARLSLPICWTLGCSVRCMGTRNKTFMRRRFIQPSQIFQNKSDNAALFPIDSSLGSFPYTSYAIYH